MNISFFFQGTSGGYAVGFKGSPVRVESGLISVVRRGSASFHSITNSGRKDKKENKRHDGIQYVQFVRAFTFKSFVLVSEAN